jgi:TatD DNase family protein
VWIDSHCHLDAFELDADRDAVREAARQAGVGLCVIPAVERANFLAVQKLAHRYNDAYALGIHPLYVPTALEADLAVLDAMLTASNNDKHLVALGEIGLDYFVPSLCTEAMRARQWLFYREQLKLAKHHALPVIVHVRRSADMLLKGLRQIKNTNGGIAHAFNGSVQQAHALIDLGFKLGFGGTLTYERSLQIRRLATELPIDSIVLETDAPDIPPKWLYVTSQARGEGAATQKNTPIELPRIGACLAQLRGLSLDAVAQKTTANVKETLFKSSLFFDQPSAVDFRHE